MSEQYFLVRKLASRYQNVAILKIIGASMMEVLHCWWWRFDGSFARLTAPVVTNHHLHHP